MRDEEGSLAVMCDYIGTESCCDLLGDGDGGGFGSNQCKPRRTLTEKKEKSKPKQIPPPISFLAQTENHPSHMPWVLRRYYTNDGRLILKEEPVEHHEYFLANRSNGRLTLQMVPLEDEVFDFDNDNDNRIQDGGLESLDLGFNDEEDDDGKDGDHVKVENNVSVTKQKSDNGGSMAKFSNSVRTSSSCYRGMAVPSVNQVHST